MDPVSVGASFMLAILSGGLVAVIAGRIAARDARKLAKEAFEDARRLQEEERKARERALLVAVVHELAGNGTMLRAGSGGTGMAVLHRSAWDQARTLVLPTEVAGALAAAYLHIDRYNAAVEGLRLVIPSGNRSWSKLWRRAPMPWRWPRCSSARSIRSTRRWGSGCTSRSRRSRFSCTPDARRGRRRKSVEAARDPLGVHVLLDEGEYKTDAGVLELTPEYGEFTEGFGAQISIGFGDDMRDHAKRNYDVRALTPTPSSRWDHAGRASFRSTSTAMETLTARVPRVPLRNGRGGRYLRSGSINCAAAATSWTNSAAVVTA
jgi:hypothetical protein